MPRGYSVVAAAIAILAGAITHDVWDGFTHEYGWAVARLPTLAQPAFPSIAARLPWFKFLQHGSTVVGGIVVLAWAVAWLRRQPRDARRYAPGAARRSIVDATTILAISTLPGIANSFPGREFGLANALGYAAVGSMSGLAVVLLVYGLLQRNSSPAISRSPMDRTYSGP
jgi:hypothetical protein